MIYQSENSECALACLAMIGWHHGYRTDLATLRQKANVSTRGASLRDILAIATLMRLSARVVSVEPSTLRQLRLPAVAHWDMAHFVVVRAVGRRQVTIHDPARGVVKLPMAEVGKHLTGIAIEFERLPDFVEVDSFKPVRLRELLVGSGKLGASLSIMLTLALATQALAVVIPLYFQIIIDRILPRQSLDTLLLVGWLFSLLVALEWALRLCRNFIALKLSRRLTLFLSESLLARLLKLPLGFFETRNITDLLGKFDSLEEVRSILAEDVVRIVSDGLMVVVGVVILACYGTLLLGTVIGCAGLYLAYRITTFDRFRLLNEEQIYRRVSQRSHLLETIQRMQAVKLGCAEDLRRIEWTRLLASDVDGDLALKRWRAKFDLAREGTLGLQTVLATLIAFAGVLHGELTVGQVVAFLTYMRLFSMSAFGLIEVVSKASVLGLHLNRLADVVRHPTEAVTDELIAHHALDGQSTHLRVRGLTFSYPASPILFEDVSFDVKRGDRLVITGPSGCGKSTLIKVLLKLHVPTDGNVWKEGHSIKATKRNVWLAKVGVVMQGDRLFSGSIRENVALGQTAIDDAMVHSACELACVAEDIDALPLRYETLAGDLGAALSGGQMQRVLIARALYRQPTLLVMDEGTANLDGHSEARILHNLKRAGITTIQAAHRQQVIADATAIVDLAPGALRVPRSARIVL
ncbi:MAG TPA: peptidase domain-containing ABC transporter [Rhodanobacter sp.]|nr:peptidase domain-containing ABC transporter [Rhodanobacter sp.]